MPQTDVATPIEMPASYGNGADLAVINAIRTLSMDAVEQAKSGHPGTPMALAPAAYVLFTRHLRFNPANPRWAGRDRFLLSCGHASMLLYSTLHLAGYDLSLEDLRQFRQWGSRTPGHPEWMHAPGVETTTGPLGQGFANGVGLAIAAKFLAGRYNRTGHDLFDQNVYGFCSDGDLMEGVASEAASLAGHLGLGKLVYLYDDNHITIEGDTALAFDREDVGRRFEAYGWHVLRVADANDLPALDAAFAAGRAETARPTLVICRSHIGWPSPNKTDSAEAHGSPLGESEIRATKLRLGLDPDAKFHVPAEAAKLGEICRHRGLILEREWNAKMAAYEAEHPELALELRAVLAGELPGGWDSNLPAWSPKDGAVETRKASGKVLNVLAKRLPTLIGGSADLAPSNNTNIEGGGTFSATGHGRNFHWGVREHGMGSILNGMALHGGVRPFGASFLIFSDYCRPAIRLAALMSAPVLYVFTHDSIGLGEDGPTHQPVESLAALRTIPNITVLRPADANETAWAWVAAIRNHNGPSLICLTRQKVPVLDQASLGSAEGTLRGAYVVIDADGGKPDAILIGTGSELSLAMSAREILAKDGLRCRVVSMPSWELFAAQPPEYRDSVLPPEVRARVAVEAGRRFGWDRWIGSDGAFVGIEHFGASAPAEVLFEKFGITAAAVAEAARSVVRPRGGGIA